jgi:hypothetical protein
MTKQNEGQEQSIVISPPKIKTVEFKIVGSAPYMQHRFSKKMELLQGHIEGKQKGKRKEHEKKDVEKDLESASYILKDGSFGIPASSFRAALISACRLASFKMTLAKLSLFIESDGNDINDGIPCVKINGKREMSIMTARNANGMPDVRIRPIWYSWNAKVRIRFDESQFNLVDVYNLFLRVGMQVGIGEGRPDSKQSAGLGYGLFDIEKG